MKTPRKKNPTIEGAVQRVRDDPDTRLAVVFAAVFAWATGFALGFVLGEREGAGTEGRERDAGS